MGIILNEIVACSHIQGPRFSLHISASIWMIYDDQIPMISVLRLEGTSENVRSRMNIPADRHHWHQDVIKLEEVLADILPLQ